MSHVFSRQPTQAYPVAVAGDGIAIIDREGRRYLDASGGAAVSCLGHNHHGHTYMGHPLACAAALAVQQTIAEEQLLGRVRRQGDRLRELLAARFGAHPNVGEIRGRGLFQGLEFVADRASKRPFAPEHKLYARIKAEAMARGLLCYPMGGTIDGRAGDHLLLAPPYIVSDGELEAIVERLAQAIAAALAAVGRAAA